MAVAPHATRVYAAFSPTLISAQDDSQATAYNGGQIEPRHFIAIMMAPFGKSTLLVLDTQRFLSSPRSAKMMARSFTLTQCGSPRATAA